MHSTLFKISSLITILFIALIACRKNDEPEIITPVTPLTPYTIEYPSYFPTLSIPADNPLTVEGIALGRKLYYDPILSNNGASCF